jgi:hypothetical protein
MIKNCVNLPQVIDFGVSANSERLGVGPNSVDSAIGVELSAPNCLHIFQTCDCHELWSSSAILQIPRRTRCCRTSLKQSISTINFHSTKN